MNILCQNFPFASWKVSDIFFSTLLVNNVYDLKRWEVLCLHLYLAAVIMSNYWLFFLLVWLAQFLLHSVMKDCFSFLFSLLLLLLKLSHHHVLREKDGRFSSASACEVSLSLALSGRTVPVKFVMSIFPTFFHLKFLYP